jgi:protein-S-isoprenylcysteine O-methyltransferase Ste14
MKAGPGAEPRPAQKVLITLAFSGLNVPILMLRILDEEKMLESDLDGYAGYTQTVRYRFVPGLW